MNWFDKIQKKINEPDDSRELKNGEVKKILLETFSKVIPEFKFNCYRNGCYYFSREKQYKGLPIYETLHIGFSLK